MTYDWNYRINTVEDAWEFARFLVLDLQVEYNPGDDFGNYLDENGKPLFDEYEAELYNHISIDCFDICDKHNLDFMEIIQVVEETDLEEDFDE